MLTRSAHDGFGKQCCVILPSEVSVASYCSSSLQPQVPGKLGAKLVGLLLLLVGPMAPRLS